MFGKKTFKNAKASQQEMCLKINLTTKSVYCLQSNTIWKQICIALNNFYFLFCIFSNKLFILAIIVQKVIIFHQFLQKVFLYFPFGLPVCLPASLSGNFPFAFFTIHVLALCSSGWLSYFSYFFRSSHMLHCNFFSSCICNGSLQKEPKTVRKTKLLIPSAIFEIRTTNIYT